MKANHNNKGFTLIELIIVITIMTVLFTAVLVNIHSKSKAKELQDNTNTFKAALSLARNYALTGYNASSTNINGYGIYASSATNYIIYANKDSTYTYSGTTGLDTVVETYALDSHASITSCTTTPCDVYFSLYKGDVAATYEFNFVHPQDASTTAKITIAALTSMISSTP